jgi:hypothetical protein
VVQQQIVLLELLEEIQYLELLQQQVEVLEPMLILQDVVALVVLVVVAVELFLVEQEIHHL